MKSGINMSTTFLQKCSLINLQNRVIDIKFLFSGISKGDIFPEFKR